MSDLRHGRAADANAGTANSRKKITCPACKEQTKIASMRTVDGSTFQAYLQDFDRNGKIALYKTHRTTYGKLHPKRYLPGEKRKAEESRSGKKLNSA